MVVAYLRISTSKQHLDNQYKGVCRYAAQRSLKVDKWYRDIVSGTVSSCERKIGSIIDSLKAADHLIVTEISRLSRKLLDIMGIIQQCVQKGVVLHSIKEGYIFEDNLNSKILGFAFGLVAEIERNLISSRTKEALAVRRASGQQLGRPRGSSPKSAILERNRNDVLRMVASGKSARAIALHYKVSVCTVTRYLKTKPPTNDSPARAPHNSPPRHSAGKPIQEDSF